MKTPTPEIRQAFYRKLVCSLPVGPITENDVAWPNVSFDTNVEKMYIAPLCLFGETRLATLSSTGMERLSGIFQISIYGVLNRGESELEEAARSFTDIFRGGTRLQVPGWNPVRILRSYRNSLQIETGGDQLSREIPRPCIVVSIDWNQDTQKGE